MENIIRKKVILHEMAAQEIMLYIKENHLHQGDKLPTERKLAELLGISRSSVRETLQTLAANDIVMIRHGSGIYVNIFDESMLKPQNGDGESNMREILLLVRNLIQARMMTEPFCIKAVSQIITPEQVDLLYRHEREEYRRMHEDKNVVIPPGLDFENLIISMQPNIILTNIHKRLNFSWKNYLALINAVALPPDRRHREHLAILNAMESKSNAKIEKAVYNHHHKTEQAIDLLLEKCADSRSSEK